MVMSLAEFTALGRNHSHDDPALWDAMIASRSAGDLALHLPLAHLHQRCRLAVAREPHPLGHFIDACKILGEAVDVDVESGVGSHGCPSCHVLAANPAFML